MAIGVRAVVTCGVNCVDGFCSYIKAHGIAKNMDSGLKNVEVMKNGN